MTAILCIRHDDHVVFYTDGACYNAGRQGRLECPLQKVRISLHPSVVLATRGTHIAGATLQQLIACEPTFDLLVDSLPAHMMTAAKYGRSLGDYVNLGALFGGWSERAQKFLLYRTWIEGPDLESLAEGVLQLETISHYKFEPWPDQKLLEERGMMKDGALDVRGGDVDIIKFMECQRQTVYRFNNQESNGEGCIVGLFIQKTVLTRESATTEIIHRWPDKIGEPLNSAAGGGS